MESEAELIAACAAGDGEAWKRLVRRYEGLVYSAALGTGLDRESAGDVFQQVWIELHRSLLRIRDPKSLPKWLTVTTRRIAYRHAVKTRHWVNEVRDEMVDPTPSAEARMAALGRRYRLEESLQAMDARCREVLGLLFFSETRISYRTVADRLGISEHTVGGLRRRCLEKLRSLMEEAP